MYRKMDIDKHMINIDEMTKKVSTDRRDEWPCNAKAYLKGEHLSTSSLLSNEDIYKSSIIRYFLLFFYRADVLFVNIFYFVQVNAS